MLRLIALLSVFSLPVAVHAATVQELYIQAESAEQNEDAVALWQELLASPSFEDLLQQEISREDVEWHLIHALIQSALETRNAGNVQEAERMLGNATKPAHIAWGWIAIGRAYQDLEMTGAAAIAFEQAKASLVHLRSRERLSHMTHALVLSQLRIANGAVIMGQDGVAAAHSMQSSVVTAPHRAAVKHALAIAELTLAENSDYTRIRAQKKSDKALAWSLAEQAKALAQSKPKSALLLAQAMPMGQREQREKAFTSLYEAFAKADRFELALEALSSMAHAPTQGRTAYRYAKKLAKDGYLARIQKLAEQIDDARYAADTWMLYGEISHDYGYDQRTRYALQQAEDAAMREDAKQRRDGALSRLAKLAAESGNYFLAERLFESVDDDALVMAARHALALSMGEAGEAEQARLIWNQYLAKTPTRYGDVVVAITKGYVSQRALIEAAEFLVGDTRIPLTDLNAAFVPLVDGLMAHGANVDAEDTIRAISMPAYRALASVQLARRYEESGDGFKSQKYADEAHQWLGRIKDKDWNETAVEAVRILAWLGYREQAQQHAEALTSKQQERVACALLEVDKSSDVSVAKQLKTLVKTLPNASLRDDCLRDQAWHLHQRDGIASAVKVVKQIRDSVKRVKTFRKVAEDQAYDSDVFGIIDTAERVAPGIPPLSDIEGSIVSKKKERSFEEELLKESSRLDKGVQMATPPMSKLGAEIPKLHELGRLSYDADYVRENVPMPTAFKADTMLFEDSIYSRKFIGTAGVASFVDAQQTMMPQVLFIEQGIVDLPSLYDHLKSLGKQDVLTRKGRIYTLHVPVYVGPHASLVVSGADVEALRLMTDRRVFINNMGRLYIVDSKVTSWDEKAQTFTYATYDTMYEYRPFITSWSRSQTYMAASDFIGLGYENSKSYGLSISSGPNSIQKFRAEEMTRPEATIIGNSFDNMLYGFYSYEADNVILVGNEYVDNVTYGVDPHDRSRWFAIAYNTAYDTQKKHGIIISREVNFSSIVGNVSFANQGSGIMIDRQSNGTLIYGNSAFENEQDGLTVFESSCKIIASNRMFNNKRAGIKVRNSKDVGIFFNELSHNRKAAVDGYSLDLRSQPEHVTRDFLLDPYSDITAMNVVGNQIESNGSGVSTENVAALLLRENSFVHQSPKLIVGDWSAELPRLLAQYDMQDAGVLMLSRCPKARFVLGDSCEYRKSGFFNGDGQTFLMNRYSDEACNKEVTP